MKQNNRQFGYRPDLGDHRDYLFASRPKAVAAPPVVTLPKTIPVKDQGNLGACTAFGVCAALEYHFLKKHKVMIDLSEMFEYYETRGLEGTIPWDAGAMIRDALKVANKIGVCTEALDPYKPSKFTYAPSAKAKAEAAKYKIESYHRVTSAMDWEQALAQGFVPVFGITVYESFMSDVVAQTGKVPMPAKTEKQEGGHCMAGWGYDRNRRVGIARNSWSQGWGAGGYCEIPYEYLFNSDLCGDLWVVTA